MARRYQIIVLTLGLLGFGLLAVYNSSSVSALKDFGDQMFYLKEQFKAIVVGLLAMAVVSRINYRRYYPLAILILIGTILSLLAVFIPHLGVRAYGATRWINLGITTVQPSEFVKIAMVIYLSAWFSSSEKGRLPAFLMLLGVILGLIMLQPDMGTAVIIAGVCLSQYYFSGAPVWHFLALGPLGAILGGLMVLITPYRMQRLFSFLDINHDPQGASYHIRQALIAIGSGGLFGLGLGNSRQKYSYLPEANTDSIFAIIAEEVGFIGSTILILILGWLYLLCFQVSINAKDNFGKLLAAGIASWLFFQTVINLGAMLALFPLTGVPLPIISYGGTAIISELIGIGIIINIDRVNSS